MKNSSSFNSQVEEKEAAMKNKKTIREMEGKEGEYDITEAEGRESFEEEKDI